MPDEYTPIYILTWNPYKFDWDWNGDYSRLCAYTQGYGAAELNWSVQSKTPKPGDRFVLLRQGTKDGNGIIGYGGIRSEPYSSMTYSRLVDIRMQKLFKEPLLTRDELFEMFPDQYWKPQQSGTKVKAKYTVKLWEILQKKAVERAV